MVRTRAIRAVAALAARGLVVPEKSLQAASPRPLALANSGLVASNETAAPQPRITDVALAEDGALHGVVVDGQAVPVPSVPVVLSQADRQVATTLSDAQGRFTLTAVRGGVYQITAGQGVAVYRVWTAASAPPAASKIALVNAQPQIVRGQMPFWDLFRTDAFLITAIVATAVAIPVAVHNLRDDNDSSS